MKKIAFLIIVSVFLAACASVEEARYKVVSKKGTIEVRQYERQIQAQTRVKGEFDDVGNEGFRRLASYIFAKKRNGENKIAMTAPVSQQVVGEKVNTSMVSSDNDGYTVAFVMPASSSIASLPVPKDDRVKLVEVAERKVVALRYSGSWSKENYLEKENKLMAELTSLGLKAKGSPEWARYDHPFQLWFLRRNEVLVEVE